MFHGENVRGCPGLSGVGVGIPVQESKFLRAAIVIWATLLNTHAHRDRQTDRHTYIQTDRRVDFCQLYMTVYTRTK